MAEKLSGRCEFEKDCPTLKYLEKLARGLKKESPHLYEIIVSDHDRLRNTYCNFEGDFQECLTYQRLSRKKRPEAESMSELSERTETTKLETEPVLSEWPRVEIK